jgi:V8-like Glu-specific endopeptidase
MHDCSKLGGNSGSCVIDLETNQVIGLHFGGRYLGRNSAVALWELRDDRLLKKGRVNFTS